MRRIDVYDGDELAATFSPEAGPVYRGRHGQRVRELVSRPTHCYNPWAGGTHSDGLRLDDWSWLITTVCAALVGGGFDVRVHGAPAMAEDEDGTIY